MRVLVPAGPSCGLRQFHLVNLKAGKQEYDLKAGNEYDEHEQRRL